MNGAVQLLRAPLTVEFTSRAGFLIVRNTAPKVMA
jgi:hypothetical protein